MKALYCGSFIVRRRYYSHWEYLAPGRERVSLGLGASTTTARWTLHRSKARRFETRRAAVRYVRREAPFSRPFEVVRVSTRFGPLAEADGPNLTQHSFDFMKGN